MKQLIPPTSNLEPRTSKPEPRWPRLYAFVIGFLVFEIALFYLFTKAFQ